MSAQDSPITAEELLQYAIDGIASEIAINYESLDAEEYHELRIKQQYLVDRLNELTQEEKDTPL